MGSSLDQYIYSNNCTTRYIEDELFLNFIYHNHINEYDDNIINDIKIGMFNNDELIFVMTFDKYPNNDYNISTQCNKLNICVINGIENMINFFKNNHIVNKLITYVDRRYSEGIEYMKLGFALVENLPPTYYYVRKNELYRFNLNTFNCEIHLAQEINPNKTEFEIMDELGYLRIYDCGYMKLEIKLE